jgi:hypothetical protein
MKLTTQYIQRTGGQHNANINIILDELLETT